MANVCFEGPWADVSGDIVRQAPQAFQKVDKSQAIP